MYYIYIYDNYTPSNVPISEPSTRNERESEMPSFPQCKEGVQGVSRKDGQHPPAIKPINQPSEQTKAIDWKTNTSMVAAV